MSTTVTIAFLQHYYYPLLSNAETPAVLKKTPFPPPSPFSSLSLCERTCMQKSSHG
ncbi:hypothetical protein J6590_093137 [Homalodisca vitripennis]|nr:hypothetical protein J6590_093137 [Homalodisca vitripennis]